MGSKGRGLQEELSNLRDDVSDLASRLSSIGSDPTGDVAEDVKKRIQKISDDIDGAMTEAKSKGREIVQAGVEGVGDTVESSIREHPFATLAIAIGVGALVGSQLRR
ncbi:YqjD family protein [Methylosinus sp. Sm6]|uniref:DUF883 family protein n=1 Tax=Methylosinus sp. Sm6 TaxID=2866948 RepID=UPI001C9980F5|nr:hypothetical protein [Methylosinus sp. Sm6]MBY6241957.1 hypothetical protein [Methylosinus sp. Sm6]